MSIDFSTLQGLTIPEGVVTQIEKDGVVLWRAIANYPEGTAVLKVAKITNKTYAGGTTYADEQFVLLDIYPKTNGTVFVSYGGLTKTITDTSGAAQPNAQQVFFGTFNGVSDSVVTPDSGVLTIEGDYYAFGESAFATSDKSTNDKYCRATTEIVSLGQPTLIPDSAFSSPLSAGSGNNKTKYLAIPEGVTAIDEYAFYHLYSLSDVSLPSSLESIGNSVFASTSISDIVLPENLKTIGDGAFKLCDELKSVMIPGSVESIGINPWQQCEILESFAVDASNAHYSTDGGVALLDAGKTQVIAFAPAVTGHYVIPLGVTSVNEEAFASAQITSVTIPDSVTTVGMTAFSGSELTSVVIPASVTTMGNCAFDTTTLTKVQILSTTPPTGGSSFFDTTNLESITVPAGCGTAYKESSSWGEYADYIVEAS